MPLRDANGKPNRCGGSVGRPGLPAWRALDPNPTVGHLAGPVAHFPRAWVLILFGRRSVFVVAAAFAILGLVASGADVAIARALESLDPQIKSVFRVVSGTYAVCLVTAALGFLVYRSIRNAASVWRFSLFAFACVAGASIAVGMLKIGFGRSRPSALFDGGVHEFVGFTLASGWESFPSGHATVIAAVATALALIVPRLTPLFVGAALVVAAGRVVIGVHYPSDAIAGLLLGAMCTLILKDWFGRRRWWIPPADSRHAPGP